MNNNYHKNQYTFTLEKNADLSTICDTINKMFELFNIKQKTETCDKGEYDNQLFDLYDKRHEAQKTQIEINKEECTHLNRQIQIQQKVIDTLKEECLKHRQSLTNPKEIMIMKQKHEQQAKMIATLSSELKETKQQLMMTNDKLNLLHHDYVHMKQNLESDCNNWKASYDSLLFNCKAFAQMTEHHDVYSKMYYPSQEEAADE